MDNAQRRSPNEQLAASEEGLEGRLKFESLLARFAEAGIDIDAMADQLQNEGAASFVKSWIELMTRIASRAPPSGRPVRQRNLGRGPN